MVFGNIPPIYGKNFYPGVAQTFVSHLPVDNNQKTLTESVLLQ